MLNILYCRFVDRVKVKNCLTILKCYYCSLFLILKQKLIDKGPRDIIAGHRTSMEFQEIYRKLS
jgi:hypothetical protein